MLTAAVEVFVAKIEDLESAFVSGLGIDGSSVEWSALGYRGIPEWDSVAHMALVAEIEDRFDVMLEVEDVIALSSFSAAQQILGKYGVVFT